MPNLKAMYRTIMDDNFPENLTIKFGDQILMYKKKSWKIKDTQSGQIINKGLRYGENPGQEAALYELMNGNLLLGDCQFIQPGNALVSAITDEDMLQFGKHPGKINLTDLDNGLNILKYLSDKPSAVILKHNNPCGVAFGSTIEDAYFKANKADRIAAFGGCCVINKPLNIPTAELIRSNYLEIIAAPEFEDGTVDILKKRKNLRIIRINKINRLQKYCDFRFVDFKSLIDGGLILQQSSINRIKSVADFITATTIHNNQEYTIKRMPTEKEYEDLLFGWNVEQGVTSNSVLYVKDGVTVGIGTGEQDRVGVAEIAVYKAYTKFADSLCFEKHNISYKDLQLAVAQGGDDHNKIEEIKKETKELHGGLIGAVMVSDAFFPFRDGVDVGIKEGIRAIVQPGGSERDFEIIEACNEATPQVAMVFTKQRAFKH
ncbi:MAG: IMP cyclohydrolase [bacterium]